MSIERFTLRKLLANVAGLALSLIITVRYICLAYVAKKIMGYVDYFITAIERRTYRGEDQRN